MLYIYLPLHIFEFSVVFLVVFELNSRGTFIMNESVNKLLYIYLRV